MEATVCYNAQQMLQAIKERKPFILDKKCTILNVARNSIGPEEAKYIARALENNSSLTQLDLSDNNIGPEGAQYIAKALENNSSLTQLYLDGNKIGPEGAQCLAKALKNNSSLTQLDLSGNNIGPEGAECLARALEINYSLTKLELQSNNIDMSSQNHIKKILSRNYSLSRQEKEKIITKKKQLQQYIVENNWDGISAYLEENIDAPVPQLLSHFTVNLSMKTFVAQLSVHSMNEISQKTGLLQQQENVKCVELEESQQALQRKIQELEKELQTAKSVKNQTDKALRESKSKLQTLTLKMTSVTENVAQTKQFYEESSKKLVQWKERLQVDLSQWTGDDVAFLLKEIDMAQQVDLFLKNKIDGSVLLELSTSDLMHLQLSFTEAKRWLKTLFLIQNYKDIYTTPPGILQWSTDTVCTWLEDNKFAHLVPVFRQNQITGGELAFIDRQDLKEHLKVEALGDCIRLEKAIKELVNVYLNEKVIKKQLAVESDEEKIAILHSVAEHQVQELKLANAELQQQLENLKSRAPEAFCCPITGEIMTDPVVASDGHTYERHAIENWLVQMNKNTSPMTNEKLKSKELTPSHTLKSMIREWIENNQQAK